MQRKRLGILHPGTMGASVGATAKSNGAAVFWVSQDRSESTVGRATKAGLEDAETVAELVRRSEVLISVCPPSAAITVAEDVARSGFRGIYVDANAVSPTSAEKIAAIVESAGAEFVDGGIIGEPAWTPGTTRFYLSGPRAADISDCFRGSNLEPIIVNGPVGAASALKMTYAAYTKGTTALLTAVLAVADRQGVRSHLQHEWSLSQPILSQEAVPRVCKNTAKAWRFVGEMQEIAATFSTAGLPRGFHDAAADVFQRLSSFKDAEPPSLDDVMKCLLTQM